MAFKDYNQFPKPKPVKIPINGKTYSFPGTISARSWTLVQRLASHMERVELALAKGETIDPEEEVLDDLEYSDVRAELFGDTEQELMDDGATSDIMRRLFQTLMAYHMSGIDAAETIWNQEGNSAGPNRAARRNTTRSTPRTPSQASPSGSTRNPAAQAGTRSQNSGD